MNIFFSPIQPSELNTVLRLFKEAAEKIAKKQIDHWQYWKNPPAEKVAWVKAGLVDNEFFFIKTTEDTLVGMVRILNEDDLYWGTQTEKAKYIHSLVIKEAYNGKCIGSKVINHVENLAKQEGCPYLRLDADAKNPKLCLYYENLGFKQVGVKQLPLSDYKLYQKQIT